MGVSQLVVSSWIYVYNSFSHARVVRKPLIWSARKTQGKPSFTLARICIGRLPDSVFICELVLVRYRCPNCRAATPGALLWLRLLLQSPSR